MPQARQNKPFDLKQALLDAYAVNERMNQFLLEHLDPCAWRAEPPGGKGRTIATIFAHIHNDRHMWLVMSAKGTKIPPLLDRRTVKRQQVKAALKRSAAAMSKLFASGLARDDLGVKNFPPDVAGMLACMLCHDAHHRGQICMLARQLGYRLPRLAGYQMWHWSKLWKECGFSR